jgi:tetratricopeptide (TPR) repeat protein
MSTGDAHDRMLRRRRGTTCALLAAACAWGCNDSPSNPAFFTSHAVKEPRIVAAREPGEWSARPLTEAAQYYATANHAPRLAPILFGPPPSLDAVVSHTPTEEIATLLPPVELPPVEAPDAAESITPPPGAAMAIAESKPPVTESAEAEPPVTTAEVAPPITTPMLEEPSEELAGAAENYREQEYSEQEASVADALPIVDDAPALVGSPTGAVVCKRAEAKIRRGYALMQRRATFAARSEFVEVLHLIAEAKDQKYGSPRRTVALANGLRAIDEAADFAPRAAAAARASVPLIVSAHRTPVGQETEARDLMPAQLADRYFQYAQLQLGAAVAGEPAGSMALHALGKLHTHLARTEPDNHPQAERAAFALQQAAILARDDNYLAAHELGVLLAESGHYNEAEQMLGDVAVRAPNDVVLRNLARVQRKLGREQLAVATEQQARALANPDGESAHGVVWVNPTTLARTGDATAPPRAIAAMPAPANHPYATSPTPPVQSAKRSVFGWFR